MGWGGLWGMSGGLNDLGHGTSSERVHSLLLTRWKADAYVALTPPSALPTLSLAHTLTGARWRRLMRPTTLLLGLGFTCTRFTHSPGNDRGGLRILCSLSSRWHSRTPFYQTVGVGVSGCGCECECACGCECGCEWVWVRVWVWV